MYFFNRIFDSSELVNEMGLGVIVWTVSHIMQCNHKQTPDIHQMLV